METIYGAVVVSRTELQIYSDTFQRRQHAWNRFNLEETNRNAFEKRRNETQRTIKNRSSLEEPRTRRVMITMTV